MNRYGQAYFQAVNRFSQAAGSLQQAQQEHDEAPDWIRPALAEDLIKARKDHAQAIAVLVDKENNEPS